MTIKAYLLDGSRLAPITIRDKARAKRYIYKLQEMYPGVHIEIF